MEINLFTILENKSNITNFLALTINYVTKKKTNTHTHTPVTWLAILTYTFC